MMLETFHRGQPAQVVLGAGGLKAVLTDTGALYVWGAKKLIPQDPAVEAALEVLKGDKGDESGSGSMLDEARDAAIARVEAEGIHDGYVLEAMLKGVASKVPAQVRIPLFDSYHKIAHVAAAKGAGENVGDGSPLLSVVTASGELFLVGDVSNLRGTCIPELTTTAGKVLSWPLQRVLFYEYLAPGMSGSDGSKHDSGGASSADSGPGSSSASSSGKRGGKSSSSAAQKESGYSGTGQLKTSADYRLVAVGGGSELNVREVRVVKSSISSRHFLALDARARVWGVGGGMKESDVGEESVTKLLKENAEKVSSGQHVISGFVPSLLDIRSPTVDIAAGERVSALLTTSLQVIVMETGSDSARVTLKKHYVKVDVADKMVGVIDEHGKAHVFESDSGYVQDTAIVADGPIVSVSGYGPRFLFTTSDGNVAEYLGVGDGSESPVSLNVSLPRQFALAVAAGPKSAMVITASMGLSSLRSPEAATPAAACKAHLRKSCVRCAWQPQMPYVCAIFGLPRLSGRYYLERLLSGLNVEYVSGQLGGSAAVVGFSDAGAMEAGRDRLNLHAQVMEGVLIWLHMVDVKPCALCDLDSSGWWYAWQEEGSVPFALDPMWEAHDPLGSLHVCANCTLSSREHPVVSLKVLQRMARDYVGEVVLECNSRGSLFVDPDFPATEASLWMPSPMAPGSRGVGMEVPREWRRLVDMMDHIPNPRILAESGDAIVDMVKGGLASDDVLGMLSMLTSRPSAISDLFLAYDVDVGVYAIRVHVEGAWSYVVVDDYIPCGSYSSGASFGRYDPDSVSERGPCYSRAVDPNDLYVALLEKAVAKVKGGYAALNVEAMAHEQRVELQHELMETFTGGEIESLSLRNMTLQQSLDSGEMWETLLRHSLCGRLMTCWREDKSVGSSDRKTEKNLLVNHAYTITGVLVVGANRLLQIRNSFGDGGWEGAWYNLKSEVIRAGRKNEFLMAYGDFYGEDGFTRVDIVDQSPETLAVSDQVKRDMVYHCGWSDVDVTRPYAYIFEVSDQNAEVVIELEQSSVFPSGVAPPPSGEIFELDDEVNGVHILDDKSSSDDDDDDGEDLGNGGGVLGLMGLPDQSLLSYVGFSSSDDEDEDEAEWASRQEALLKQMKTALAEEPPLAGDLPVFNDHIGLGRVYSGVDLEDATSLAERSTSEDALAPVLESLDRLRVRKRLKASFDQKAEAKALFEPPQATLDALSQSSSDGSVLSRGQQEICLLVCLWRSEENVSIIPPRTIGDTQLPPMLCGDLRVAHVIRQVFPTKTKRISVSLQLWPQEDYLYCIFPSTYSTGAMRCSMDLYGAARLHSVAQAPIINHVLESDDEGVDDEDESDVVVLAIPPSGGVGDGGMMGRGVVGAGVRRLGVHQHQHQHQHQQQYAGAGAGAHQQYAGAGAHQQYAGGA